MVLDAPLGIKQRYIIPGIADSTGFSGKIPTR
jgi:hypothetical protein